jgi:hypothetical protein
MTLVITEKTASVHVLHIVAKLDARNRGEAAAIAHRLGLTGDPGCMTRQGRRPGLALTRGAPPRCMARQASGVP